MIDLILWRHADAHEGWPDSKRQLTDLGQQQARAVASWLRPRLPNKYWLLSSPADRAIQTASALSNDIRVDERLLVSAQVNDYAELVEWPYGPQGCPDMLIVVAHQPILGAFASLLLSGTAQGWPFAKAAIWWFSARDCDADGSTSLKAMMTPDLV